MKFDLLFPNVKDGFQDRQYPVIVYCINDPSGSCQICDDKTHWIEFSGECHICSSECYNQFWKNYFKAYNRASKRDDELRAV